jgi:hypothetical protein
MSNIAVKAAPSGRWTLRDKAPRFILGVVAVLRKTNA